MLYAAAVDVKIIHSSLARAVSSLASTFMAATVLWRSEISEVIAAECTASHAVGWHEMRKVVICDG